MTTTTITHDDLVCLAQSIAEAHHQADVAQLADKETLQADGPVGYLTGACCVEDDIRAEWCDEPIAVVEAALTESDEVRRLVCLAYRQMSR